MSGCAHGAERVAVVIPNWNGRHLLEACLTSLRRQTFTAFRTYVVDNGSQDGSVTYMRANFPEVRVIALPENLGFSAAVNAGIRASAGEYVAALNNDTEADPHWLEELVRTLDARPDIGFCASKLLDFRKRTVIDCVGDGYGRMGLSFKIGAGETDAGQFDAPFEVFGACAAASIYRRAMLDDIGLFDEDFFAYMEDVDLSIRAQLAGYRCLAVPAAKVYHIGTASTGGGPSAFSVRLTTRNAYYILLKDIPLRLLPRILALSLAAQAALLALCLVTDRHPGLRRNLGAYFRGVGAALRGARGMLAKRRAVQRRRRIDPDALLERMRRSERQRTGRPAARPAGG